MTTQECISAVDETESGSQDMTEDIKNISNLIEMKWENFLSLEANIGWRLMTFEKINKNCR